MRYFHAILVLLLTFMLGCNRTPQDENEPDTSSESDEVVLSYVSTGEGSGGGTGGASPPFGACALTAPSETVVLAEVTRDFEATLYQPCETDSAFYSSHLHTGLEIVRQSGPPVSDTIEETFWFPSVSDVNVDANTPAGTMVLASLRQAGEDWIVMAAVVVEPTSGDEAAQQEAVTDHHRPIELPAEWSEIVSETSRAQADYATECDENPWYLDGTRQMSDAEFDTFIHSYQIPADCTQDAGRQDF